MDNCIHGRNGYDCLECLKENNFDAIVSRSHNEFDNFVLKPLYQESEKEAGYYIGSTLIAKRYVTVYALPDQKSKVLKKFAPGDMVGKIYSFITRGNIIWWELGKHQGYTLALPGYFDEQTAKNTASGKAYNEQIKKDSELDLHQITSPLKFLFGHWKLLLIAVAIVLIIIVAIKFK